MFLNEKMQWKENSCNVQVNYFSLYCMEFMYFILVLLQVCCIKSKVIEGWRCCREKCLNVIIILNHGKLREVSEN